MRDKYFGSHELRAHTEVVQRSSERSFGITFAVVLTLAAGLALWKGSHHWWMWLAAGAAFGVLAFAAPQSLALPNKAWTRFGLVLHAVVNPLVLALMFFACITPIGFLMRLSGKDPLRRTFDPGADTYWIVREPPGPAPDTFQRQF